MKPLVDKKYKLERFQGKGGWTYARIPQIVQNKAKPFGAVKVKGTIDGYAIQKCHLMPMGNGKLFLPVKAEIRKAIKKKEGDYVHVILYPDTDPLEVPEELMLCLRDEPVALEFFNALSDSEQKFYIDYIFSAKKLDTRVSRMTKTINRLLQGLKLYDKVEK
ncbi:MAG TPA: YdeI/OmpD-associated family protein [Ohtaekwangia sp.]|uniref:YdeI/OmpD-associated family protein n=1 Tax=Ohtaekwangia sp. TaxID=2066019 RepID=UPI002F937FEB